jgi:hypothetical protein
LLSAAFPIPSYVICLRGTTVKIAYILHTLSRKLFQSLRTTLLPYVST